MTSYTRTFVLSVFLLGCLMGGIGYGWKYAEPLINQPIHQLVVHGNIPQHAKNAIKQKLQKITQARFFDLDLAAMQASTQVNPWVNKAKVTRVWPDKVLIDASPNVFVAKWTNERTSLTESLLIADPQKERPTPLKTQVNAPGYVSLVTQNWQVVQVLKRWVSDYEKLPRLQGSTLLVPTLVVPEMGRQYYVMNQIVSQADLNIDSFMVNDRGAIKLKLNNFIDVLLSHDNGTKQLNNVMQIYNHSLAAVANDVAVIDGRYTQGAAVKFKQSLLDEKLGLGTQSKTNKLSDSVPIVPVGSSSKSIGGLQ